MVDPRCVLVWVLKGAWSSREKRGKKKEKEIVWKFEWIHWSRLNWNDASRIWKNLHKSKKYSWKKLKKNIFNKR